MSFRRLIPLPKRFCCNPKCENGDKQFVSLRKGQMYCCAACKCEVAESRRQQGVSENKHQRLERK